MHELFTKQIYGYTFCIYSVPNLEYEVQRMFMILEKMGEDMYVDGMQLNLGITTYTLKVEAKRVIVLSPDYEANPFKDKTKNISLALWMQLHQLLFLQDYDIPSTTISFDTLVKYQEEAMLEDDIYLTRSRESDVFFVGVNDKEERETHTCYVYELLKKRSSLIKALSIPNGYVVFFHKADIKIIFNGDNQEVNPKTQLKH
ncbi:MAG: hypothetical protein ACK5KR_05065 [Breznakia sp.]